MSIILFVIGAGILLVGSIRFGDFEAEGAKVRAAGFVLTLPLIIRQVLLFMLAAITSGDENAVNFVIFLELPLLGVATGLAYYLVTLEEDGTSAFFKQQPPQQQSDRRNPTNRPSASRERFSESPEKTDDPTITPPPSAQQKPNRPVHPLTGRPMEEKNTEEKTPPPPAQRRPAPQNRPAAKPASRKPSSRRNFPTVMTTAEAAMYLNLTEEAVMDLIEEGKLSAARINYQYRISRTVLDDFIKAQQQNKD